MLRSKFDVEGTCNSEGEEDIIYYKDNYSSEDFVTKRLHGITEMELHLVVRRFKV